MITWATKVTGNTTRMVGFNHKMRKVAELIETNDEWLLKIGSQEFKLNGRGCKSPSDYIESIVEPIPVTTYRNIRTPYFQFSRRGGTSWEVWEE